MMKRSELILLLLTCSIHDHCTQDDEEEEDTTEIYAQALIATGTPP
jgi:hypothetical protein